MSKTMSRRVGVARPEAAVTGTGIPRSVVRKPRGFASPTVASEARAAVALSRPSLDDGNRSSRVAARASLSFDKQGSESTDLSSGGSRFNSDCVDVLVGATSGKVVQLYRTPLLSEEALKTLLDRAQREVSADIDGLESEACFNLEVKQCNNADECTKCAPTWRLDAGVCKKCDESTCKKCDPVSQVCVRCHPG